MISGVAILGAERRLRARILLPMKRAALLPVLLCAACSGTGIHLPFASVHAHAVHRFFPDLDRRENAVRYGRWNALESAWNAGVTAEVDRRLEASFRETMKREPDYPPDARLCAPVFAREAPGLFGALFDADRLEQEVTDALAATDASPETTSSRVEKSLERYRRSRFALASPAAAPVDPRLSELSTARLLVEGDWLFAHAAEDLAASAFRDQRWKVKATIDRFDVQFQAPSAPLQSSWYKSFAPTFSGSYAAAAELFDRATSFRIEIFQALLAPDPAERREAARAVGRRYGISG
jgi:hypothetical protein